MCEVGGQIMAISSDRSPGVAPVDHRCFTDTQVTHKEIELLDMLYASTAEAVEAVGPPAPEQLPVCQRF